MPVPASGLTHALLLPAAAAAAGGCRCGCLGPAVAGLDEAPSAGAPAAAGRTCFLAQCCPSGQKPILKARQTGVSGGWLMCR